MQEGRREGENGWGKRKNGGRGRCKDWRGGEESDGVERDITEKKGPKGEGRDVKNGGGERRVKGGSRERMGDKGREGKKGGGQGTGRKNGEGANEGRQVSAYYPQSGSHNPTRT